MSARLPILQHSPLDQQATWSTEEAPAPTTGAWVPSRFNLRATTDDGRLVVANSFHGTISVFPADQKERVLSLLSRQGVQGKSEGAVKYLADRGFLVSREMDEDASLKLAFGRQHYRTDILELVLLPSEDCNFRCTYCYEEFTRGTMRPDVRQGLKNLVLRRARSLRHLRIGWFGGEPLYGFAAIEELAPFFSDLARDHDLTYLSHMTTNGYLLTPEVAEKLLSWRVNEFQITVDGSPEDHDRSRPARDGSRTFETIFDNLKSLSRRTDDFEVDIRVNFDRNNHPRIPQFLDRVERELGGDPRFLLRFRPVGRWGGDNDANLDVCGREEETRIFEAMERETHRRGLKLSDGFKQLLGVGAQKCYAARPTHFVIGAAGQVMKCTVELDKDQQNVLGHVTTDGQLDIDFGKLARWTEPAFLTTAKCQRCTVSPVCQGMSCPLVRLRASEAPCVGTRSRWKYQMLSAVERQTSVRNRFVPDAT